MEKAHARADFALKARSAGPVTNFANNPRGETAMSRLKAFLERKLAKQDAKRAQRVGNQPVWPYPLPRILAAVVLVALLTGLPVRAQQPGTIVCTPTGGQVICQPQPTATAKRLAIVAAAIAGVAVVCYAVPTKSTRKPPRAHNPGDLVAGYLK